ncbi:MAG TPA: hypothetical protein VH206_08595 [Xanthobacteraceae bacterium]|jgi:hypothetical protein|nr:hypothetical protein [Xanthobacteraceae bacterium]
MLELVLYCCLFLRLRYPNHVGAVTEIGDRAWLSCADFVASLFGGQKTAAVPVHAFDVWTAQTLDCLLDQLDAYVGSIA